MFSPPDLSGRVAIVTGASRGIGRAVALGLARAGADVCVAARSTESTEQLPGTIHETAAAVRELGRRAIAVPVDVRHPEKIHAMVETTVAELGRVDILVNNAGALWWRSVEDTPVRRYDLVNDVNARASFVAARAVLQPMIEQGDGGWIINMSPPIDLGMLPGKVAYCISKFGMTLVAHGLAAEVREHDIAVNALWPATVIESQASKNFGLGGPAQWRTAEILVDATLAICSHDASQLSGQALIDEDILARVGVDDFSPYLCVEDGDPIRIVGKGSVSAEFGTGAGGGDRAKVLE